MGLPAIPLGPLMRLSTKLLIIGELVLLLLALALLLPTRSSMRDQVITDLQNQLAAVAATATLQLDGDLHLAVRDPEDATSPAFLKLREQLRAVRDVNQLKSDHLYTFYLGEDQQLHYAVMPHEGEPFVGERYPMKPHHRRALETGRTSVSGLYEDVNGRWISAAAPIRLRTDSPLVEVARAIVPLTQVGDADSRDHEPTPLSPPIHHRRACTRRRVRWWDCSK